LNQGSWRISAPRLWTIQGAGIAVENNRGRDDEANRVSFHIFFQMKTVSVLKKLQLSFSGGDFVGENWGRCYRRESARIYRVRNEKRFLSLFTLCVRACVFCLFLERNSLNRFRFSCCRCYPIRIRAVLKGERGNCPMRSG
jgi:hypothetical protein